MNDHISNLATILLDKGISKQKFGRILNIKGATIDKYLNKPYIMRYFQMQRLAHFLNISIDHVISIIEVDLESQSMVIDGEENFTPVNSIGFGKPLESFNEITNYKSDRLKKIEEQIEKNTVEIYLLKNNKNNETNQVEVVNKSKSLSILNECIDYLDLDFISQEKYQKVKDKLESLVISSNK